MVAHAVVQLVLHLAVCHAVKPMIRKETKVSVMDDGTVVVFNEDHPMDGVMDDGRGRQEDKDGREEEEQGGRQEDKMDAKKTKVDAKKTKDGRHEDKDRRQEEEQDGRQEDKMNGKTGAKKTKDGRQGDEDGRQENKDGRQEVLDDGTKMDANKKKRKGTETTINDNGHTSSVENNGPNGEDTKNHDRRSEGHDQRRDGTKEGAKEHDTKEYDTKEHDTKEYEQRSDDTKEYDTKVGAKENDRTIVDFIEDDGLTTLEENNGAVVEKTSVLLARSLTKKADCNSHPMEDACPNGECTWTGSSCATDCQIYSTKYNFKRFNLASVRECCPKYCAASIYRGCLNTATIYFGGSGSG